MNTDILTTTKISAAQKRQSIYPYYAGFSDAFALTMLRQLGVKRGSRVLDPWNGTGTTTAAARALGAQSTGVDISPVLDTVARARFASGDDAAFVSERMSEFIADVPDGLDIDALASIYTRTIASASSPDDINRRALAMCCLFPAARKAYSTTKTRNPSWFSEKIPEYEAIKVNKDFTLNIIKAICSKISAYNGTGPAPRIVLGDIKEVKLGRSKYDCILTSPPYLTRVDYVKATLPEITLMNAANGKIDILSLRHSMIGTPLTKPINTAIADKLPNRVKHTL